MLCCSHLEIHNDFTFDLVLSLMGQQNVHTSIGDTHKTCMFCSLLPHTHTVFAMPHEHRILADLLCVGIQPDST